MLVLIQACSDIPANQQKSDSGVQKASTKVQTDANGRTIEQENIIKRLKHDNDIGAIKHLYIISSYTGEVMEYSTVVGKITSGGKRLSPKTVNSSAGNTVIGVEPNTVYINGLRYSTDEVLDDGGAYGESAAYFYWFDVQDNYHQYFPSGGTYVHISDRPLKIKKMSMTFEIEK